MKNLRPIRGRYYIAGLIAEGEHERQDFKYAITDACKIARSLSAFANNAGGRLLVGVKDNGVIAGVRTEEDVYVLEQAAEMYCRPALPLKVTPFLCDGGAVVIRAEVERSPRRPVKARDEDGRWRAYYRVNDENILAPSLMVRGWVKAGSGTGELLALDGWHRKVMETVAERGPVAVDDVCAKVRCPRREAERALVSLLALSVVKLEYIDGRFMLVSAEPAENTQF